MRICRHNFHRRHGRSCTSQRLRVYETRIVDCACNPWATLGSHCAQNVIRWYAWRTFPDSMDVRLGSVKLHDCRHFQRLPWKTHSTGNLQRSVWAVGVACDCYDTVNISQHQSTYSQHTVNIQSTHSQHLACSARNICKFI